MIAYASAGYCPATANQPTRMTEAGFRRRCAMHQEETAYCSGICRGKFLPAGLEFIKVDTYQKKVDEMGTVKRYVGTCETCGGEGKSLAMHFGKKVCSMCQVMRITAKNNPDLVKEALKEFGNLGGELVQGDAAQRVRTTTLLEQKLEEQSANLKDATGKLQLAEEKLQKLGDERRLELSELELWLFAEGEIVPPAWNVIERVIAMANQKDALVKKIIQLESSIATGQAEWSRKYASLYAEIAEELGLDISSPSNLPDAVAVIKAESERLREQLAEAAGREAQREVAIAETKTMHPYRLPENIEFGGVFLHAEHRDSAVLDLALDCLAGKVTGLTPERLAALR